MIFYKHPETGKLYNLERAMTIQVAFGDKSIHIEWDTIHAEELHFSTKVDCKSAFRDIQCRLSPGNYF